MSSTTFLNVYTCGCIHDGYGGVPFVSQAKPVIPALVPGQPWIETVFNGFPCSEDCMFNPCSGVADCSCILCAEYDDSDVEILSLAHGCQERTWWKAQMLMARIRCLPGGLHDFAGIATGNDDNDLKATFPHLAKAKDYLARMVSMVEDRAPKVFWHMCHLVLRELTVQNIEYFDSLREAVEEREFEVAIQEAREEIEAEETQDRSNQIVEECTTGPVRQSSSKRTFQEYARGEDLPDYEYYAEEIPSGSPSKKSKSSTPEHSSTVQDAPSPVNESAQSAYLRWFRRELNKLWRGVPKDADYVSRKLRVVGLQFETPNTYKTRRPCALNLAYDKRDSAIWFGGNGLAAVPGAGEHLWANSSVFKGYPCYPWYVEGADDGATMVPREPVASAGELTAEVWHEMASDWDETAADVADSPSWLRPSYRHDLDMSDDEDEADWQEQELNPDNWGQDEGVMQIQCALPVDDWQARELHPDCWEED